MIRRRIYFSILDPAYVRPGGTWWYRDFSPEADCSPNHSRPSSARLKMVRAERSSATSKPNYRCKPVSVACEPSLWPGLHHAPGNGFRTSETKGPNPLPNGLRFPQRPRTGHYTRPKPRKIEGIPRRRGTRG